MAQQLVERQVAMLQGQADQALDDMEAMTGVRLPRRPKPQPVNLVQPTFNSLNIKDSTVGMVNQGSNLQSVTVALNILSRSGDQDLAGALKTLTEAAANDTALTPAQKQEAVQILSVLASEATAPKGQRRAGAARPLLHRLREVLGTAADFGTVLTSALDVIADAFGP